MALAVRIKRWAKHVLRPVTQSWQTRDKLAADLRKIGVRPGGCLLVHSSLSSLGYVLGGPTAVIAALRDSVGTQGTLVLPSHSWSWMNKGCREFDARTTPTCVGALPEMFRKMPGVVRSLHPTHSVSALGPRAQPLVEGHEQAETPCGDQTPYERLLSDGGQILFIGVDLANNTAFHTAEAMAKVSYLLDEQPQQFEITDQSGKRKTVRLFMHKAQVPRRFAEMEDLLLAEGIATKGQVGGARTLLVEGRKFLDFMVSLLREQPDYLRNSYDG